MPSRFFRSRRFSQRAVRQLRMRVIAGVSGGRRLKAPRGAATRPTLARVRESIFSRLAARIGFESRTVLDLFAGSGAMGIEALSRGAQHAVFVDSSRVAAAAIRRNLEALAIVDRARVCAIDAGRALTELAAQGARFDLVFVDAPYQRGLSGAVLDRLVALELLAPDAWLVVEMSRREEPPQSAGLETISVATLGDQRIALYRRV